jgi:hypothetical protein
LKTEITQDVEVSFRLVNLDFEGFVEFQFSENIIFRKLSPEDLHIKYPVKSMIIGVGEFERANWDNHLIEATIKLNLTESKLKELVTVVQTNKLENSITNPFQFNGQIENSLPYATHCYIRTKSRHIKCTLVYKGFKFMPDKLKLHQIQSIAKSYTILQLAASDEVLSRALNRFYIAKKEDLHSPNLVNSPNWDKVVDFVISLETIFLSSPNDIKSELTYRFRMNGTSLLHDITDFDKKVLFDVLGKIYSVRSRIVHGGIESRIVKEIDLIFSQLNISDKSEGNSIGKLLIISNLLENWIRQLIEKLVNIEPENRPYKNEGGWEDYIWNDKIG